MNNELTIVIPAKNEEHHLPRLLDSLCRQDYPRLRATRVYVADAGSTDRTAEVALAYTDRLSIEIIPGGTPSEGRNAGAARARSKYLLFLDADVELGDAGLISRALRRMERRRLHCATAFILSRERRLLDNLMYGVNALIQLSSKYAKPFSPGAFMLFEGARFRELGGFDERVRYAEDFFLTRNIARRRFGVVPGYVFTPGRRFAKMGRCKFVGLFFRTVVNHRNDTFFFQDHGYW